MRKIYLYFFLLFALFGLKTHAQNVSSEGKEFWAVFPPHDKSQNGTTATMYIFVTSKQTSEVTVSCGSYTETKSIPANTAIYFAVPRNNSYVGFDVQNTVVSNRGIHIQVTNGMPSVSVYGHMFASARSAASLILPVNTLGQTYYSFNYTQDIGSGSDVAQNYFILQAIVDNTKLILHEEGGTTKDILLPKAGDIYCYSNGKADLTGTYVEVDPVSSACTRFAAFSGTSSVAIGYPGCNAVTRDPLFQQLYPVTSWGKNYAAVPFASSYYYLRIMAQEDNTNITVNGSPIQLNKGENYQTNLLINASLINADKLVSVAQYSLSQNCSGSRFGDPDMVILNPIEFNIKDVTVFSSDKENIAEKYINVVMNSDKKDSFRINGQKPVENWQTFSDISYSYIQIAVYEESLNLTASDGFNAIAYGFGNYESYAYSAGTNLASSQYISIASSADGSSYVSACINTPANFKVTLPYIVNNISLKFSDGSVFDQPNPTYQNKQNGNGVLYEYYFPVNKIFTTAQKLSVNAVIDFQAGANSCFSGTQEIIFEVDVDPKPTASIAVTDKICEGVAVDFTDASTSNKEGRAITKWIWDFGDGTVSTEQNPVHTFQTTGQQTVKLSVGTESNCMSDVVSKIIFVNAKPVVQLQAPDKSCINSKVDFSLTDNAVGITNTLDFGDGTQQTLTGSSTVHQYAESKTYLVTLTSTNESGCQNIVHKQIAIAPAMLADFTMPESCVSDLVVFANNSKNSDGSANGLSYRWDFGDLNSAQNQSAALNGAHKFSKTGTYKITLTVTNASGCAAVTEKDFVVNGSNPVADFALTDGNTICDDSKLMVTNKSYVDFGNITKLVWDFNGITTVVDDPSPGQLFTFDVPKIPSALLQQQFLLKLVAYSGESCVSAEKNQLITVSASLVIDFSTVNPICENAAPVQLLVSETTGLPGNGTFAGTGVTTNGLFDPKLAEKGSHTITYTYVGSSGCSAIAEQTIIVSELKQANAGQDQVILEGGNVRIGSIISEEGLTYKWTPASGLDHDDIAQPSASPNEDITYTLTVTSAAGCSTTDNVYIKVLKNLDIPNTITPNGDGINDVWNIKYLSTYANAQIEIFARNGERVFLSKGYDKPFDGTYRGGDLPIGTYYYVISPNTAGKKKITGSLVIVR